MASLAPIFKKAYIGLGVAISLYGIVLVILTNPYLQRHVLYAHKIQTTWLYDINKPEQFGFAKNQVTPFNITTPDNELLYAWHVMPLGLYAKHEAELLGQPSGCVEDITKTKAFELLTKDPEARLIINFHGNAGNVAQGWRTDSYRAYSDVDPSHIHILAIDYRGYGYSSGTPTEKGLMTDGETAINWALNIAKIPPSRIIILGHSLGTAVSSAVVSLFASRSIEFAGVILIAPFTDLPNLLTTYAIGGWVPILSPLRRTPALQALFSHYIVDTWPTSERLSEFMRLSKRARLFLIHARDDYEIPCHHSEKLFEIVANSTIQGGGLDSETLRKMVERRTVVKDERALVRTWKVDAGKFVREEIVAYGGHNRVMTYTPVSLAVWKAFGLDEGGALPVE